MERPALTAARDHLLRAEARLHFATDIADQDRNALTASAAAALALVQALMAGNQYSSVTLNDAQRRAA